MTETITGAEYISEAHVRHIMRYVQARDWLNDKPYKILDAACGTGYGSKLLAKKHLVDGIDFNEEAIKEAEKVFIPNCTFKQADLLRSEGNYKCGAIVSIETIEHFNRYDGAKLVRNFADWLPKHGVLIISTPYCSLSGPSPITTQHLWEYSLTDFEQLIAGNGFQIEILKPERHEGKAGRLGYCMVKAIKR